jgi:hypothetical protein
MVMFAVLQQYTFSAHDYSGEVERRMIDAQKKLEKMTHWGKRTVEVIDIILLVLLISIIWMYSSNLSG